MIEEFFLNPETMSINDYLKDVSCLHEKVSEYFNVECARMAKETQETYKTMLENEKLNEESSDVNAVYDKLATYAQGMIKWNHPGGMININPPASVPSVAASSYFSLYNPNGAQDMSCGLLLTTELAVIKMICQLVGWDETYSGGLFTFGGKSTNLHAVKHGIQRINSNFMANGIDEDIIVFSSKQGHPCHAEVCGWLGIGKKGCRRISTDEMGVINLKELETEMDKTLSAGKKIATIIANGCTTIQMTIDPIDKIVALRDKMVDKYQLDYIPRVHVDSVIGWVWLFFKNYNFKKNKLEFSPKALAKIKRLKDAIKNVYLADSFGVDFHKTGFCAYLASIYMVKDRTELYNQENVKPIDYDELEFGNYSPFEYSLELSRPINGMIASYVNLKLFGIEGYQRIMGNLMECSEYLKELISKKDCFEVINGEDSDGFVTLITVCDKKHPIKFADLKDSSEEEIIEFGQFNYKFYLYLFEKQKTNECWFVLDYSSGYHKLKNGKKIGVLKVYPMSPYFSKRDVERFVCDIDKFLEDFISVKDIFEIKEVPHKPRPFCYR